MVMNESEFFFIKNSILALFLSLIFIMNLIAVKKEYKRFRWFVKPMIVPMIIGFYILNIEKADFRWVVVIALAFGFAGDLFLLVRRTAAFLVGLVAFLAGHVLYILIFLSISGFPEVSSPRVGWFGLSLIIIYIPLIFLLKKYAGRLMWPAGLYLFILLLMCFSSFTLIGKADIASVVLTLSGSVLFVISDLTLGIRKFTGKIKDNSILVMATYMPAQLMIAIGMIIAGGAL